MSATVGFWQRILALVGLGPAAFHDTTIHGVPNLAIVGPHLWRMWQPADAEAWAYLTRWVAPEAVVIKLNDRAEGVDTPPDGWVVVDSPIPPYDDKPWSVVDKPDPVVVRTLVDFIAKRWKDGNTIVVHCSHGRDRTGLLVALLGMRLFGWTKAEALADMLRHGFRWELPGLDAYFAEDTE
jgi:hypothetical protein